MDVAPEEEDLPNIDEDNIGVAPEFKVPETIIPLDVFDAEGLTPFHYSLIKPGCEKWCEVLLEMKLELITQKV